MSRIVFDLEGKVGLEDKNFINKAKRVKQALTDVQNKFKRVSNTSANLRRPTKEYQALTKQVKAAEKAVEDLKKKQARQAAQHTKSAEYKAMQKDIAMTEAELDKLIEKQIGWAEAGVDPSARPFQELDAQIESTGKKLEKMQADLKAIAETGATDEEAQDWYKTADAIDSAEQELREYKAQQQAMQSSGRAFQKDARKNPFFGGMKNFGKNSAANLGKMIAPQKRISRGFQNMGKQLKKVKKGLFMGAGIKGLVRLGVAGAVALYSIRMLKEGLGNLRAYDARTNASINQMSSSLLTLKNALATAFAPILNVVAPILSKFIDWLTAAITAVAHFMAALTGQSQVTIARKAISGVGGAADDAAGSLGNASDAAEEYKRSLMGFDQIEKLDDPTSGSGGGGSGGSGGGGSGGAGSMFETVPVDSVMADWADKIKEAWENADFYDIGRAVGEKLRDSLQQIPWDDIQAVGAKIGKSIATGLNGFFETPELGTTIGNTIAEALNTIVITVNSFTVNFHWESLGTFVSDSINGFFKTFDWKLTGQTMSSLATGILDATIAAVRGVNWKNVGSSIIEMIASIDYVGIATRLITLLGDAIAGASGLLQGAIDTLKQKLSDWISSGEIWKDIGEMGKAMLELDIKVIGAAWDLLQSIIKFGAEVLVSLFKSGWSSIKEFLFGTGNEDGVFSASIEYAAKKVGDVWNTITSTVKGTAEYAAKKAGDVWNKLTDTVKGTAEYAAKKAGDIWSKLNDTVKGTANYYADKAGKTWGKLTDTLSGTVNYYASKAGKTWGKLTKKLKATVEFSAKWAKGALSWLKGKAKGLFGKKAQGGVYKHGRWQPVQTAATGGAFNQGQMFIAREAGPELVGRIGGNTAVMNNDQIVASVATGVANAVAAVMKNTSGGEVNVYLQGDAGTFFRVMQSKANDYTRATGQPAFPV